MTSEILPLPESENPIINLSTFVLSIRDDLDDSSEGLSMLLLERAGEYVKEAVSKHPQFKIEGASVNIRTRVEVAGVPFDARIGVGFGSGHQERRQRKRARGQHGMRGHP